MKNIICAICNTNKHTEILYKANFNKEKLTAETFSARRTPDQTHYQFLKCKKCGLIFSSPIVSKEKLEKLYEKSNFNYSNESKLLANTYAKYLKKLTFKKDLNNIKLLDVGCGNGFFMEKVKSLGIKNVFGVEPGKASVLKASTDVRKNIHIGVLENTIFKKNSFDIICCFHTLDHVFSPNLFLKIIYKLLKKNGKILFVTHNTNGLSVKLFKEKSPIFDIEHIYLFNEKTLREIFQKNGFKKTKVYNLKNTYHIAYWARLLPLPALFKKLLIAFLKYTQIEKIPLSVPVGNIAIVAERVI